MGFRFPDSLRALAVPGQAREGAFLSLCFSLALVVSSAADPVGDSVILQKSGMQERRGFSLPVLPQDCSKLGSGHTPKTLVALLQTLMLLFLFPFQATQHQSLPKIIPKSNLGLAKPLWNAHRDLSNASLSRNVQQPPLKDHP